MRKVLSMLLVIVMILALASCATIEADRASENLSLEADNFNIVRQLTVINADTTDNQLEVTVEDENGDYQKHFIGLSDNVTYVVEQKRSEDVSKYKYTLNYNPKMWILVEIKTVE